MRKGLKVLGWVVGVLLVAALGVLGWAYWAANRYYDQRWAPHDAAFAIPFSLSDVEIAALAPERTSAGAPAKAPLAGVDLQQVATDRAVARGKHLVESRVGCNGCHGPDFGGAVVIDSPLVGYWAAPNLTTGAGSVTMGFTAKDWDHAVRHGLRHDLRTSSMPSEEFRNLSDRELSDIVSYIRTAPPVDRTIRPVKIGPLFAVMVASDRNTSLVAYTIDHNKAHAVEPPPIGPTVELGQHIAQVCTSCHGPHLSGGKMQGDPNMPIVANLTPHETGLKGWTEADFISALRTGKRKDGSAISEFMPWKAYGQMTDTELQATWAYLQTVPAMAKGNH